MSKGRKKFRSAVGASALTDDTYPKGYYVLDYTGAVVACFDEAPPAVKLAKWYAKNFGVGDVQHGTRRKRFLASGAVFTVKK